MKVTRKALAQVVEILMSEADVRMATIYFDGQTVIRGTARHRLDARARSTTIVLTVGKPNFVERRFIRLCRQAKEPLPVRKVQLKFWPKKR